jgi:uncharacterized protein YjiS (DUF1127 family)
MIASSAKAGLHQAEPWTAGIVRAGGRFVASVSALRRAAAERAQLLALDERILRDIGITRVDALREADRPLWRWYE